MKVAYIFSTQGHLVSYKLGKMILPQLEEDAHGVEVVGMLLMACDQCAYEREIENILVEGATIGCFPNLYGALSGNMPDQIITL